MKVTEIKRTCIACPSQWEGKIATGEYFYIRYRWGQLSYGTGETLEAAIVDSIPRKNISDDLHGFGGFLSDSDMEKHLAAFKFDFSEAKWLTVRDDSGCFTF